MIIDEFKKLASTKELVSIELSDFDSSKITGFVLSVSPDLLLIQLINGDGTSDGYTVFEPSLISGVSWGDRELRCIKLLSDKRSNVLPIVLGAKTFQKSVLVLSKKYKAIGIYAYDDRKKFEIANVVDSDNVWLKLHCFGARKTLSRLTKLIRREDVCRIEFGSRYIADIVDLNNEQ